MKPLVTLVLSIFAASARCESVGHADVAIADPWVVLTSYLTNLSYDNGLYAAAAILLASAVLMSFMPKYRYAAGHGTEPAAAAAAPQQA